MHLLPQVVPPENSTTENLSLEKRLICTTERDKALKDEFHYCNLVEKLETDIKRSENHHALPSCSYM